MHVLECMFSNHALGDEFREREHRKNRGLGRSSLVFAPLLSEAHIGLSTPGIFRMVFHRHGQHFDRKNCYDQESVFQLVQQHLDESLKDPQDMVRRVHVRFKRLED